MRIYKYKNVMLEKIQKKTRKINAIIKQSQIRRIKIYIFVTLVIFNSITQIYAIENSDITYGDYRVLCYKDPNKYITYMEREQTNYEYYYIKDGVEYSVYCLDLGKKGAEENNDGYIVNAQEKINDKTLNNIVLNCYPYKSIEDLGVENKSQARFASQFAVWTYINNLDLNSIKATEARYECVVNAIKSIYNCGISQNNYNVELNESVSEQSVEEINGKKYYVRSLDLSRMTNIIQIDLTCDDENVNIIKNDKGYNIYVPVDLVKNEYNVDLNVLLKAKENAALLGISTLAGYQNTILTLKDEFDTKVNKNIKFDDLKTEITIVKKDIDTNEPIKGVIFSVSTDGETYKDYYTDDKGEIRFNIYNNSQGKIFIKEKKALENYRIDEKIYDVEVKPNVDRKIEFFNEKKKGKIKIVKKTKEYNEITKIDENMPLSNVSFYIYNQNMNIVDELHTDEKGIAYTKDIPLGKYYIKEYETKDGYKVLDKMVEVNIEKDKEIVLVEILNENVDINNTLPVTGM